MVNENYPQLIEFISTSSGISVEELERKVEAKQAKLSGLITKEGAVQIIAAELGVSFDNQLVKIGQVVPGMKKINLVGKIVTMFPIREYNKNGRSGRIGSFILADDTSNIRTVLWDENHIDLIAKGEVIESGIIEITNAMLRNGELHLTGFSEIKNSNHAIESIVAERPVVTKQILEFNTNDNASTRAFVVNIFEPRFFETCPECRKKVSETGECGEHGKIVPDKRVLLNMVLDDGSDSIRAVMFSEQIEKLMSRDELENQELFSIKKQEFLGKEFVVSGQIRKNKMFENNEIIVNDVKEIDLDNLITELEK